MSRKRGIFSAIITLAQICMLAVIVALSHGGAGAQAAGSITITGTVIDQSSRGVANVSVYATDPGGNTVEFGPSTTASDGSYELAVDAGTYDFHFDPPSGSGLNPIVDSNVTVLSNQTIDIQLMPITHTFSGTISDNDGNPIPDVNVRLEQQNGASAGDFTSATGNFSIKAQAGSYSVYFSYSGPDDGTTLGGYPVSAYDFRPSNDTITEDLTNSDASQDFTFSFVRLSVTVKDSSGDPESGVSVSSSGSGSTTVASGGSSYTLSNNDGPTSVRADSNGVATLLVPQGTQFATNSICATLTDGTHLCNDTAITASSDASAELDEPVTHVLSGTMTDNNDNPIPNLTVFLNGSSGRAEGVTDATGHFRVTAPAGSYSVNFESDNATYHLDNTGITEDLTSSNVTQSFTIPVAKLSVTVKDSSGNPEPNQSVVVNSNSGIVTIGSGSNSYSATVQEYDGEDTNANGVATMAVPEGVMFNPGGITAHFADGTSTSNSGEITASNDVGLVLQELTTHTLSGTVTDNQGNPISNLAVFLRDNDGNGAEGDTDSTGNFRVTVPAGSYSVSFDSDNATYYLSNTGITEDLTSADVTQNFAIPLVTLSVTLKDSSGNPEPNQSVGIDSSSGTVTISSGSNNYSAAVIESDGANTNANGVATMVVPEGTVFNPGTITVTFADGTHTSNDSMITALSDVGVVLQAEPPSPSAPTNLTAQSPTQYPGLSWTGVSGASSYNIYRNGTLVGSTTSTTYIDNSAPEGTNTYYVTAVNSSGESGPSNSVDAVVDRTPPSVSNLQLSRRIVTRFGLVPLTITADASDALSGVTAGEFYIDTDPGQGNGTLMTYANGQITTQTTVKGLKVGKHTLYVRVQDRAANWSTVAAETFVVV